MKRFLYIFLFLLTTAGAPTLAGATGLPDDADLNGWAWSATIGWISMTCENTNNCATDGGVDYGVTIEPSGALTGYAWSSNIGWIKFNGLSQFPTGAGTVGASARVAGSYPNLTLEGWARACSGTAAGDCSSMTPRTDGWDGWIALSGSQHSVAFDTEGVVNNSYSWGDEVVGWVSWNGTADDGGGYGVSFTDIDITAFSASLGSFDDFLGVYDSITLLAAVSGIPAGETVDYTVFVDGVSTQVNGTLSADGTFTATFNDVPFTAETATVEVDMPAPGAVSELDETNVRTVDLSLATPTAQMVLEVVDQREVLQTGDSFQLDWSIAAAFTVTCELRGPGVSESFTVTGTPGVPAGRGSLPTPVSSGTDPRITVTNIQTAGTYVLRCDDDEISVSVDVVPQVQEI